MKNVTVKIKKIKGDHPFKTSPAKKLLKKETFYDVTAIKVHAYHSDVYLSGIENAFNSVHFDFYLGDEYQEDGIQALLGHPITEISYMRLEIKS